MKKFSLILAALVLFAGVSFAHPVVKQDKKDDKTKSTKSTKSTDKTNKDHKTPVKNKEGKSDKK